MGREGQDPLTQLIPLERVTQPETTCPTPPGTRWDTILVQLGPQQRVTEVPQNTAWRDIMVLRKITWGDIMTEPLSMEWRDIMMEPLVMKWGDIMMEPLNMELGVIMEVQLETTMGVEMGWGDMVTRFICVSPSGALESATPQ